MVPVVQVAPERARAEAREVGATALATEVAILPGAQHNPRCNIFSTLTLGRYGEVVVK